MQSISFQYIQSTGWSVASLPKLDSSQTLVLVFGALEFIDIKTPIEQLVRAFPKSCIIGCSALGEILEADLYEHSLTVMVVKFEHTRLQMAFAPVHQAKDSFNAGRSIAMQLNAPDLRGVLLLSSGNPGDATELLLGINLPAKVIVTGGIAAGSTEPAHTWVINQGKLMTRAVVAVGFYGASVAIRYGSQGGWKFAGY